MTHELQTSLALGTSQTGLTLSAALVDTGGTIDATKRDITTGFTEIGAGIYAWNYAAYADGFRGTVVFYVGTLGAASDFTGVTVKAQAAINPEQVETGRVVWTHSSRVLTSTSSSGGSVTVDGTTITVTRGDTTSIQITGLGDISDRTLLWFTAKRKDSIPDSEADVQIEEGSGLLRIAGASAGSGETGSITVDDQTNGDITIAMSAAAADNLPQYTGGTYDVQVKRSSGDVSTLTSGEFNISADVTRAIS